MRVSAGVHFYSVEQFIKLFYNIYFDNQTVIVVPHKKFLPYLNLDLLNKLNKKQDIE